MKIPCEIVVWNVLPIVRREVARELVSTYHLPQAAVARKFGVTDAAISQYLKKKRGDCAVIENSPKYSEFIGKVRESAGAIAEGRSSFEDEMCGVCQFIREIGLLEEIYREQFGTVPDPDSIVCSSMKPDKPHSMKSA